MKYNFLKILKDKLKINKKPESQKAVKQLSELQIKFLASQKAAKYVKEIRDKNFLHPTKKLALELAELEKKYIEINMEYVKFYENKRNEDLSKDTLSALQKELDEVTTKILCK